MGFQRKPDDEVSEATLRRRARREQEKAYLAQREAKPTKQRSYTGTRSKAGDEATITQLAEHFAPLIARHPDLGLRMMTVRLMLEHRRISVGDVMEVTGRSHEWVLRCVRPQMVHLTNDYSAPNKVSPKAAAERLDEIESAITLITSQRGGVQASCGCSDEALATTAVHLARARISSS